VEPLPLALVGWLFAILSVIALGLGALTIVALHRGGEHERRLLARTVLNDALLFGIWILGLAGAVGVLRLESWGRNVLELFCWVLIPLVILSAGSRLAAVRRQADAEGTSVRWVPAIAGVLVIALPLVTLAGATIHTLRGEEAQRAFAR
jgi:predicted permease